MIRQATPGLPFGVVFLEGTDAWTVQDFSSHFQFSRHLWLRDLQRPYSVAGHTAMMTAWLGHPMEGALPYGYTPTFALVLAPLLPLPPVAAYALWVLLPTLILAGWTWRWAGSESEDLRVCAILFIVAGLSATMIRGAQLGQTAAWSAGMLLAIFFRQRKTASPSAPDWLAVFLLFLLSAKPPLAVTASLALWWAGERRTVWNAFGLTIVWFGLVTMWLGSSWIRDYVSLLTHYNVNDAPAALALSLEPSRMSNFRNFLFGFGVWSDAFCARASAVMWLAGGGVFSLLLWEKRLSLFAALALSLAVYEAFCPHLTYTEDILTTGIVCFLATQTTLKRAWPWLTAALFCVVSVGPGKLLMQTAVGAQVVFMVKLGLLALVAWYGLKPSGPRQGTTSLQVPSPPAA